LPESGYYEILVTSKAKEAFDYQLTLSLWWFLELSFWELHPIRKRHNAL
jgi:hypothetical protein